MYVLAGMTYFSSLGLLFLFFVYCTSTGSWEQETDLYWLHPKYELQWITTWKYFRDYPYYVSKGHDFADYKTELPKYASLVSSAANPGIVIVCKIFSLTFLFDPNFNFLTVLAYNPVTQTVTKNG